MVDCERSGCEAELIECARSGNRAAFTTLVERYEPSIRAYLLRLTGDRDAALDLAQETFVHAYESLGRTRAGLQMRAWLYRIATNLAYDYFRHERRVSWVPLSRVDLWTSADHSDAVEQRELVRRTMERLRPEERAVLLLCGMERMRYEEAAVVLRISTDAVRMRLHRAIARFRAIYAEVGAEMVG